MIKSFKHKGLRLFFNTESTSGVRSDHAKRLALILGRLNVAKEPRDMALPGLHLHQLKGERTGYFAVWVNGNWRVVFRFAQGHVYDVDYLDYH